MEIRQHTEELERQILSPWAVKSAESKGRLKPEPPCSIRTDFQRDRDRIIHSKAFRRLKHKTQVFIAPEGDHYRTRLTHTLEVAQIARTIARALRLNEDLTEAIALGHDLGHTPFGHAGEDALAEVYPPGFQHNEQSLRVVDLLEGGTGLNLTFEVRDGILNHTGPNKPVTLEGQIVRVADRIAYLNHDIDDALRAGVLTIAEIPREILQVLGNDRRTRINNLVIDLIRESENRPEITFSPPFQRAMDELRKFMFQAVYIDSEAKKEEQKAKEVVKNLYHHFAAHPDEVPGLTGIRGRAETERAVVDYIAGMTDRFAINTFVDHFLPRPWQQT